MEGVDGVRRPAGDWGRRTVLVTGPTGLVGARLVHRLLERGASVVCFLRDHDHASDLWRGGDIDRVRVATGRLEDFGHVRAAVVEHEVDTVFHLGAQPIVGAARRDPLGTMTSNVLGTCHVLEACRLHAADRVRRLVLASSDKVYGDAPLLPADERAALAARHPYDVSKSCGDLIGQSYARTYAMPVAIARCGNIFGPGDLNWSRLVPGTIRALLRGERPEIRSDGAPLRDYLYVDDAVDGYLALADWLDADADDGTGPGADDGAGDRAFNFSAETPLTVLEMTRRIRAAAGREDLEPRILGTARGEIAAQHLDAGRARRELGWTARHDLDAALGLTVAWYRRVLAGAFPASALRSVLA